MNLILWNCPTDGFSSSRGDVQGTPVGRQFVTPSPDGWLNGTLYPICTGAPGDPVRDPQGGYVPETIAWDAQRGCIVGYRRNQMLFTLQRLR